MYNRYLRWVVAHRVFALTGLIVLVLIAGFFMRGLTLRSDLQRLLPDGSSSVEGLKTLEANYADQLGRLTVVLTGADQPTREHSAKLLMEKLQKLDDVDRVVSNPAFDLVKHRFAFLKLEELEKIESKIAKRVKWEKKQANPLFVSLKKSKPPSVFEDENTLAQKTPKQFYQTETQLFLFVHPTFPASDLDRTRLLLGNVEQVIATIEPGVEYAFTGRYAKRVLQQTLMSQDVAKASSFALVLLVLFLLAFFRNMRLVFIAVVPLLIGVVVAAALVNLIFGSLNIITGFLAAVIMGLGVDFGIHFCIAFSNQVGGSAQTKESLMDSWNAIVPTTGIANLYSAITTAIAFGFLTLSSFRAFFEFGVIAFVGMLCVIVLYFVAVPVFIAFIRPEHFRVTQKDRRPFTQSSYIISVVIVIASIATILLGAGDLHFDRSFKYLQITDTAMHRLDKQVNDVLGMSQTPSVILVENDAHRDAVIDALTSRRETDSSIGNIIRLEQFVPSPSVYDALKRIVDLTKTIPKKTKLDPKLVELLDEVKFAVSEPLTAATLPASIRTPLSRKDQIGGVVLVMPNEDLGTADGTARFAAAIQNLPGPSGEPVDALSEVQLLAEIITMVQSDMLLVVAANLIAIFFIAFIALKRRNWLRFAINLVLSIGTAMCAIALVGIPLNFMNVLIVPVLVGLSVDASFHMFSQMEARTGGDRHVMVALFGSFATSAIGFGAMSVSIHPGLSSLGFSAITALVSVGGVNLALYRIWLHRDEDK